MERIGRIEPRIAELLDRPELADKPIFLGETNIAHMQTSHPEDYEKYGEHIARIISEPDYVCTNRKDDSIEYVKEFLLHGEYVKVAVRVSAGGRFFARSLYTLNRQRTLNFIAKGILKKT